MKVFVNDIEVNVYYGAKVKRAVMVFLRDQNLPINLAGLAVRDQWNNIVDMDGALRTGSKLYINI